MTAKELSQLFFDSYSHVNVVDGKGRVTGCCAMSFLSGGQESRWGGWYNYLLYFHSHFGDLFTDGTAYFRLKTEFGE